MANALFNMAKYDEAKKLFDEFSPSNEMLIVSRLSGIGACAEALGNHKEAAENFEKAATKYAKDPNAAENLSNAARNYGEAGEKEKAIEIYKRIRKSYPTSPFARDVDRFIAQLSV
jgi:TolA-binding protein